MDNDAEDPKPQDSKRPGFQDELKKTAGEIGGGLLRGLREGGKRFADQQKEQKAEQARLRMLTSKELLLCLMLPPLGFYQLWKHRDEIKKEQCVLSVFGGLMTTCIAGFFALVLLAGTLEKVEDYQRGREREKKQQLARSQQAEVLPIFEEKLQRGIDSYLAEEYRRSDQAFFDAAKYVDDVEEEAREAYFEFTWREKKAEATLGRAAAVLALREGNAAMALIEQALDEHSDPTFPVASAQCEQFLRQSIERRRQRAREQDPEWIQNELNRKVNDATVDRIRRGY